MATSSAVQSRRYGVFLSFRGVDTRNSFVSHLCEALRQQGIPTFLDSQEFERGREISELINAIEESNVSIIIFSENYADSPWCLDELAKIMECKKTRGQQVVPVFYHVDPSEVEDQTGSYGEGFAKHETNRENKAKVPIWRTALQEAAGLSGWVIGSDRPESVQVKEIVRDISRKLSCQNPYDLEGFVGLQPKIQQVESLLWGMRGSVAREDVRRLIGIWGMGGIGKTTLAEVVFHKYASHFQGSCFLRNVRERSNNGGDELQKHLLSEIFQGENLSTGRMLISLHFRRVLVVLDDVDSNQQFEGIIGNHPFGLGSRIIVTSRDKNVLENVVDQDCIYEVSTLSRDEALQLFNLSAMKEKYQARSHFELSTRVVNYAHGNPLALKVLGSFLWNKSLGEWESAVLKLERTPNTDILKVLRVSYDALDYHDKQIFLDIACFFKGRSLSEVESVLDACGFHAPIGLRNLTDKSLVAVSNFGLLDMHDLLRELGRQIVREECIEEPGKRSRLWDHIDICNVFTKDEGTEKVQGISLNNYEGGVSRLTILPFVFRKMTQLKFLRIKKYHLNLLGGLYYLPDELRYLEWNSYPLRCLPSNFSPGKLVRLDMSGSRIEQLWVGIQDLPNLKMMNLSHCKHLVEIPDLSTAAKLEELYCDRCESLLEISPSISNLINIHHLRFSFCTEIRSVPSTTSISSLELLNLFGCSSLETFPDVSSNIEWLDLHDTAIEEIPASSLASLSQLWYLDLSDCRNLATLPSSIGCLSSLRKLYLSGSNVESIPASIKQLSRLELLDVRHCRRLQSLPQLPWSLFKLRAEECTSLQNVSLTSTSAPIEGSEWLDRYNTNEDLFDFCFGGCYGLNENARRNIFVHAQQQIPFLATARRNLLDDYRPSPECVNLGCFFLVPGNETPEWIGAHSRGSSITIELPPNWCNPNFLGFAFCAVIDVDSIGEMSWPTKFRLPCLSLTIDNDNCSNSHWVEIDMEVQLTSHLRRSRPIANRVRCPAVEQQHVLVYYAAYFPAEGDCQYNELSCSIKISPGYADHRQVGKCGVRLLYEDEEFKNDSKDACNEKDKELETRGEQKKASPSSATETKRKGVWACLQNLFRK